MPAHGQHPRSDPIAPSTRREHRAGDDPRVRRALELAVLLTLSCPVEAAESPGRRNVQVLTPRERAARAAAEAAPAPPTTPKAHQTVHTNTPPLSPADRNVDAGAPPVGPQRVTSPSVVWDRRRFVDTNSPARPPGEFNPDPGTPRGQKLPTEPFFQAEPSPAAAFEGDPVATELALPRWQLRRDTLVPRAPAAVGIPYGTEPLPPGQTLPRHDIRSNDKIELPVHGSPEYPLTRSGQGIPPDTTPMPDRYKVGFGFTPWRRYSSGLSEQPYERPTPRLWHPYYQSRLKGDVPVIGQDVFLNLIATSDTAVEFRQVPTPSNVSTARPDSAEVFGRSEQIGIQQNFGFALELFKGETAFKPAHWTIKVQPVFNVNYALVKETTTLSPDPRGIDGGPNTPPFSTTTGPFPSFDPHNPSDVAKLLDGQLQRAPDSTQGTRYTDRTRSYFALQEYFVEYHLGDLSDNYDFFAVKAGNQGFNQDFRGFLFNDVNLGGRLFGNWDDNHWQYNLAGFDMREKDTFSGLNTFDQRDQKVFFANVFRQDFLWKGYTAQLSFAANLDEPGTHYDRTASLVRPAPLGTVKEHGIEAFYLGWGGDGHIGRWNVSHQFYQAFGEDSFNQVAGRGQDINARMAALEVSYDRDWLRYKASFFYASGDHDVDDTTAGGFDGIIDNPNFTGGAFSYYVHQGFNLGGTSVALKQPNSLFPNLRTSKSQGQANFVNPGIFIYSLGLDLDTTPKLKTFLNFNYLRFAETDPLQTSIFQDKIRSELGFDLSLGFQYRPLLTDNIIITAGIGVLIPGSGYRDIYRNSTQPVANFDDTQPSRIGQPDAFLYSGVLAINFTY